MKKNELRNMKEEFISNISHELRTPLAVAKGCIELVLEEKLNKEQRMLLALCTDNLDKLNQLVDDLLIISQLRDDSCLDLEYVNLSAEIKECIKEASPVALARGIKVMDDVQPDLPAILGDKRKIKKAFSCVLENAVKFSNEGGKVHVYSQARENFVAISFKDNGIGVPMRERRKIFDCFYQVDMSSKRRYNGMGLGLAIASKVVTMHKGKISLRSNNGSGTIFTIKLPTNGHVFRKLKDKIYI